MNMNNSSMVQNLSDQINYQAGRYADPNAGPPSMNEQQMQGNNAQSSWASLHIDPYTAEQNNMQQGQQYGQQWQQAQQGTQFGQQWQQGGQQSGNQYGMGQEAQFGALELMKVHEVLNLHINGINHFEIYRSYVKDPNLMQILDNQLNHMYSGYKNMVNYLHSKGIGQAVPYRAPKAASVKYGLRQPAPVQPNASMEEMDDSDVASAMMTCAKSSASICTTAALECADSNLRSMMMDCVVSSVNQAYETFQYMNQAGMYQVPTLAQQTTETMTNIYQVGSGPSM